MSCSLTLINRNKFNGIYKSESSELIHNYMVEHHHRAESSILISIHFMNKWNRIELYARKTKERTREKKENYAYLKFIRNEKKNTANKTWTLTFWVLSPLLLLLLFRNFFFFFLKSRELWMELIEFIRFEANKCKLNNFGANFCFLSHYYVCVCLRFISSAASPHKPKSERWRTLNENFITFCCKRNGDFHSLMYMREWVVAMRI